MPESPYDDASTSHRIMIVYGTRPEAVKVAPVVRALAEAPGFTPVVAVTGQHRSMLDQVNEVFGIVPDHDLDIFRDGQTLGDITTRSLTGVTQVLTADRPDAVLVQGDTSTTFAAALAAFHDRIPVVHLEAGLRTNDASSPFPEEINRRLTTQLTSLHLAPTLASRDNLLAENVEASSIAVTGNSVIDALLWTVGRRLAYGDPLLDVLDTSDRPVLLVTAHRRESWGAPLEEVGRAVARLARLHRDLVVVFPIHRNPLVREAVLPALQGLPNVIVTEPLPYGGFCRLMARSTVILTDSGGVQEEGPSLGKPVLVMRDTTERPEAVHAGTARLVGTDGDEIVASVTRLLQDEDAYAEMANAVNPYGDGLAAARTVAALRHFYGEGERAPDFRAQSSGLRRAPRQRDPALRPHHARV